MKRFLFVLILISIALIVAGNSQAQESAPQALLLNAEGPLTYSMLDYLNRGLEAAEAQEVRLVIFQLNTPGGEGGLMTEMVEVIRASEIPVVVYIAPRGAIAGSAGTVITLAGHVAAMAPETLIGAASPVGPQGEDLSETLDAKIKQIVRAQVRALAEDRPPEAIALAEDTIENATAVTATEALEIGLIDLIADDIPDLLRQLDGRRVETIAGTITLNTQFLQVAEFDLSLLEELQSILVNPNIVFILLAIGVQAILIELGSPGGWVAGFIGVVSLALAAYGLGILPVNWFGLVFLATAFVLFFLELKAPTHGALTVVGVASFIGGALVLFNSSETPQFYRVSVPLVVVTGILTAATFFAAVTFAIRAQRTPVRMGHSALIGRTGRVQVPIPARGQGKVQLGGELWSAELAAGEKPMKENQLVEVAAVDGLRLKVKRSD